MPAIVADRRVNYSRQDWWNAEGISHGGFESRGILDTDFDNAQRGPLDGRQIALQRAPQLDGWRHRASTATRKQHVSGARFGFRAPFHQPARNAGSDIRSADCGQEIVGELAVEAKADDSIPRCDVGAGGEERYRGSVPAHLASQPGAKVRWESQAELRPGLGFDVLDDGGEARAVVGISFGGVVATLYHKVACVERALGGQ